MLWILAGAVAEMTGRRGRIVGDAKGQGVFELRAKPDSTEMDSLNVSETGMCSEVDMLIHLSFITMSESYSLDCKLESPAKLARTCMQRSRRV